MRLPFLDPDRPVFPAPERAARSPNGLLAAGGNLTVATLRDAYRRGIFPWFEPGQPPLWWSPDPRTVLLPSELKVSRSLAKTARNSQYSIRFDGDFDAVISACAATST